MKRLLCFSCFLAGFIGASTLQAATSEGKLSADYEKLSKEFDEKRQAYFKAYENAKTDQERENLPVKYPDSREYAKKLLAMAEQNPADPGALDALVWIVQNGGVYDRETGPKVLALLKEHHLQSEKLKDVCGRLAYGSLKESHDFLQTALEKNPHDDVKGAAALALGRRLLQDSSKNGAEAEKYFNLVIDKHGSKSQKKAARGELFELHHLAIGKVAPEIEGQDVDGDKFKLSDYRGKVVVLDFWGDW